MRKPIDQLRLDDLLTFPIWEFALDEEEGQGQDETWVRPLNRKTIPRDAYSLSVAARFVTASGNQLSGMVEVNTRGEVKTGHGALLLPDTSLFLPEPRFRGAEGLYAKVALALHLSQAEVFPLRFTLNALVEGEIAYRRGTYA